MNRLHRIRTFLGLRPSIVALLTMVILVGMGERMAERFLPLYLIALGGGAMAVGLLGALDNLLSALYSYPGGYVAERLGTKPALLLFNFMAMAGYLIVIAIPRWEAVIFGAFLFLSWSAVSLPATMELVGRVLPRKKRAMGVTMHSLVRRIPMAVGPILGGICVDTWGIVDGIRIAFLGALGLAGLSALLQQAYISRNAATRSSGTVPEANPFKMMHQMSPALRNLLVSDILVRFCEQIPNAFVVLWCMERISQPVSGLQFGLLTGIEMATAVIIYIPVAYFADLGHKKPFVVATFVFFTAFPVVLLFSRSLWPLVGAFIIRGLKEFGEPTRKSLILDLAPEHRRAGMFGLYYLLRDAVVAGGALGGAFLWTIGPEVNFLTAFAFGLIGTAWFAMRGTDLRDRTARGSPS